MANMQAKVALAAMAAILPLAGYWYLSKTDTCAQSHNESRAMQAPPEQTLPPAAIAKIMQQTGQSAQALPHMFFDQLPSSLADVGLPAPLQTDENGVLILDERLRSVFEHYLMAIGEEPLSAIVGRIQHHLQKALSVQNYALAANLLEGYLQYRNNIGVIINNHALYTDAASFDLPAIVAVKRDIRASRSDFMPADVAATLFEKEDAYDHYTLEKLRINTNERLSEQQKVHALAALDEQALQTGVIGSTLSSALALSRQQAVNLRGAKAPDATVYEARRALLGEAVADRLALLDAERSEWQQRVREYRQELASIAGYPEEEKAHLAEEIRRRHFQGSERIRIRALDSNR